MADFPNTNIPATSIAVQNNRIIKAGEADTTQHSTEYMVKKGHGGSTVTPWSPGYTPTKFRNTFNASGSYTIHDIVSVTDANPITDEFGIAHTPTVGSFICVQAIPPLRNTSDRNSINAASIPDFIKAQWLRTSGVNYVPTVPEPTGSLLYWRQLGGSGGSANPVWL